MEYLVDMQGFKQPVEDFILKELVIIPLIDDNSEPLIRLFKEPYSWRKLTNKYRRENLWLKYNYHGLNWYSGEYPYTDVGLILHEALKDATKVHVLGSIKKKWLERFKFKFDICDIAEMGFPPLDKIKLVTVCPHHNGAYRASCALHNVRLMKQFFKESSTPLELRELPMECD